MKKSIVALSSLFCAHHLIAMTMKEIKNPLYENLENLQNQNYLLFHTLKYKLFNSNFILDKHNQDILKSYNIFCDEDGNIVGQQHILALIKDPDTFKQLQQSSPRNKQRSISAPERVKIDMSEMVMEESTV